MGFEQLAELRDRLRAEKAQVSAETPAAPKRKPAPPAKPEKPQKPAKRREKDPAVEAIWPLQKHFPLAFPLNPAPKVPLKEGILKDAEQHLELLGITREQLKLGIATWCQGHRYWACMVEGANRLDLNGQPAGAVTASHALHAKRQRSQDRRKRAKPKAPDSAATAPEQSGEAPAAP